MTDIIDLDDFLETYPEAYWLETRAGHIRYANGLGEGSNNESGWFCTECDAITDGHSCDECG